MLWQHWGCDIEEVKQKIQREGLHTGRSSSYKRKPRGHDQAYRQSQHPAFPLVPIHFTT